jgi:hypothetical protein
MYKQFNGAVNLAKLFGLEGNQALLCANNAIKRDFGFDCMELMDQKALVCEKQEIDLNPTNLGILLSEREGLKISAYGMNKILEAAKLQIRINEKQWIPTDLGKRYAVLKDVGKMSGGVPIQQLMWKKDVLDIIHLNK